MIHYTIGADVEYLDDGKWLPAKVIAYSYEDLGDGSEPYVTVKCLAYHGLQHTYSGPPLRMCLRPAHAPYTVIELKHGLRGERLEWKSDYATTPWHAAHQYMQERRPKAKDGDVFIVRVLDRLGKVTDVKIRVRLKPMYELL